VKLGKSSTGHAAVNGTCSTLVPMVHISFLRALISHRTKECTRGPPGDHSLVSWIWQGEGSEFTRRKMLSLRAGRETRHCLSPGDTWSWAKREHQIRKVQGQRYLQVKWVHAGLALLWALPGQPVPLHHHSSWEYFFPNIQSEPLLAQSKAISSHPIAVIWEKSWSPQCLARSSEDTGGVWP